ncbi:MAG: ferritin-like domain-containing protein [Acidobacteriia bacterium]|nr:ferritin-like domain-containing protein [Terriglobia bacterium]
MKKNEIVREALSNAPNRRSLLRKLAIAGAAVGASESLLRAQTPAPSDVVQFALNLEYMEAEFYSIATTGQTLEQRGVPVDGDGKTGPTTTMYGKVNVTRLPANDIAADEIAHVQTLRTALLNNGVTPIAKPPINLDAMASMGASLQNERTFLVLARAFEDVGISAYNGGAAALSGSPFLMTAARINSVEGEHVGYIRTAIAAANIPTTPLDDADVIPPPSGNNQFSTNLANGLTAYRMFGQVLYLVYGMAANVTAGGFFPQGVNGLLNTSSAPATAANLS